jgi:hypothetical protein
VQFNQVKRPGAVLHGDASRGLDTCAAPKAWANSKQDKDAENAAVFIARTSMMFSIRQHPSQMAHTTTG